MRHRFDAPHKLRRHPAGFLTVGHRHAVQYDILSVGEPCPFDGVVSGFPVENHGPVGDDVALCRGRFCRLCFSSSSRFSRFFRLFRRRCRFVSAGYSCFAGRLRARCFPRGSRYSPEPRSPRAVGSPCIRALSRLRFLEDPSVAAGDIVSDIGRCRVAVLPLQASQCPHLRLRLPDDLHDALRVGGAGAPEQ